ncbi:LPS-assembly protein LptD [Sansalvadorimonas sp. 2012CJ34-2]|uniref:LPS-assembly protein LptD n=1 Tax=Parendozoicomonas callyspongiae TaxID=2942213 RepID=A0ABT0PKE5_9GAMM|nr:LPS-assembly protein LptD [Sansalvadorimonas sp. 2012CJ34-2]MCL6271808.1 LPS-assembly protein LptD [Sansalvadorimonas sp. 2012CJ34-2]
MAKNIFTLKNKLPLVITTSLLAGMPIIPALAASAPLAPDQQWRCDPGTTGEGWICRTVTRKAGPVPFVAREPVVAAIKEVPDTSVTTSGTSTAETSAAAIAQPVPVVLVQGELPDEATGTGEVRRSASVEKAFATLDWISIDQLPADKKKRSALSCHGGYQEPVRPGIDFKGDPNNEPLYAEADQSSYLETGQGILTGNVMIRQGYRQVESNKANLNRNTGETTFTGDVVIREPNILMLGERAEVNIDSGRSKLIGAKYVFHDKRIRGEAHSILRRESGVIDMEQATYTTCPPSSCVWQLNGDTIELNPITGFGTATNATVDMWGIPVFYVPRISFPLDDRRTSGFLYPTIAFDSSKNDFDYTQPYYWNIAPNMDATITPRVMTKRGALVEAEYRYLTQSASGELGGAYSTPDGLTKGNLNKDKNRWFVNLKRKQDLTGNWNYQINYTDTSDREYFTDFGTSLDVKSTSPLKQEIYSTYNGGGDSSHQYTFTVGHQTLKNMTQDSDDPYNKDIDLNLKGDWDIGKGFGFSYLFDYTDFQRDKKWDYQKQVWVDKANDVKKGIWTTGPSDSINNAVGGRLYGETAIKYRIENSYSFLEPGVKLRSVHYDLDRLQQAYITKTGRSKSDATKPDTTAPTYYLDGGLFFDRDTTLGGLKFTQTLEPRARYAYTPYRGGQDLNPVFDSSETSFTYNSLWRDDRFNGYDRIGDTNQLSLGLTSRFLEEGGFERFRFGIGQIFYFQHRKTYINPSLSATTDSNGKDNSDINFNESEKQLLQANKASTSPLASQLVWNIRRDLRLTQDWMYNTNAGHNQEYATGLQYLPENGGVINMRYRYRDLVDRAEKNSLGNNTGRYVNGNLEEADFSTVWPVTYDWSLLARYTYDITNKRHMERSFGFEQESCCYMVRVMYRNWIDPSEDIDTAKADKGIFLEFVLKGLGSLTGSKVNTFLQGISGYSKRKD